jgi:hypothetical protein
MDQQQDASECYIHIVYFSYIDLLTEGNILSFPSQPYKLNLHTGPNQTLIQTSNSKQNICLTALYQINLLMNTFCLKNVYLITLQTLFKSNETLGHPEMLHQVSITQQNPRCPHQLHIQPHMLRRHMKAMEMDFTVSMRKLL